MILPVCIHTEYQQGINEYFYKPVKIVFIQCDVKFIYIVICVKQYFVSPDYE